MQFDLSVAADGRALIDFPVFEYSRASFDRVARELEGLLGLSVLAGSAAPAGDAAGGGAGAGSAAAGGAWRPGLGFGDFEAPAVTDFVIQYVGGFELRMGRASFALIFPTPLRQYEAAIRMKTELRWKPEGRVYAWAPVSDEVEELVGILYRTLAFLMFESVEYENEAGDVINASIDDIKQVVAAIRNGDDWTVEDVHGIYFNTAGAKPDPVPAAWSDKFLKLAGEAGRALTAHTQSRKVQ